MKKFLAATALLLAIVSVNTPVSAQKSKILQPTVKFDQNPVSYAETKAFSDGRGVWLEWKTESESKNLGFYVYRMVGGEKELVSQSLIPGAYLQTREEKTTSGNYSFYDRRGDFNSSYVIESYHVNGARRFSEVIQTKLVDDLTTVAGVSSEQLENQANDAKPSVSGNDSVLPEDLATEVANFTLPPDPVTQRWVAAQPGVRIEVKNTGFYRVSRAQLQTAGFDVNAPTARWQLYVNGVEQAINIGGSGDYIEFYGKGIDTLNTDTQIYFLVVGSTNGKRIGSAIRRRISGSVVSNSYSQFFFKKERAVYMSNLLNGDTENFVGGTVINATGGTVDFNLSGIDFTAAAASIDVRIQGLTQVSHQTKVFLNNTEVGTLNGNSFDSMSGRFTFPTALLIEGVNSLKMVSLNNIPGGASDISLSDSLKVNFARRYRADQNRLSFHVPNYKNSYAENFSSANIRVFDLTNSDAPILVNGLNVEANNGSFRVNLPSNRGRVLFAVEDSGLLAAASISANIPSTLSTTAHNARMIIISHKDFLTPATAWANYRRGQGMTVEVVNIEDIYDEFNYGALGADCIRDFLNYARTNWQTAPNYILLVGDATYDPKNYFGGGGNLLPTRLVDTVYSEVGSDETLADFNDDGLAEIAIGRIPARDAATVTLALNKVTAFEQTVPQAPARGALFASDLPDGYDFEGSSNRLCAQLPTTIPCVKINRGQPNAGTGLMAALNTGKYLVNYSGHGNAGVWATGGFFGNTQAAQLTNADRLSIFTMLTCLNGYFIQPTDSLSEVLMKNPNGGAVAAWASSGLTTPDIQEIMGLRFYNQVGAGNITRIGDLIKDAKTTIDFGRDVRLSWVLLGDPAMKVR
ncbi:MAG: C25 family cysteine peptidase [Pyrinomonadaceae bacterium]|nr:C25 family cysteine peptidase [Pyrinomonadaceae bacterium]